MFQIVLIANKHDNSTGISMITQFSQPAFHILKCQVLGNIVHHQSADSTAVVPVMSTADVTATIYHSK